MAQIDLREATIKIWDGTLPTHTFDMSASLSDLTLTAVSRHMCSRKISVTIVNPGSGTVSLSVAVANEYDITVTLGYATGAVTSTAKNVADAINAHATAKLLVLATYEGNGSGLCNGKSKAYLTGQNSLTVKVGEGNLSYTEHRKVQFALDRGLMDTVRTDNDDPMDVQLDFTWEWLTSETGETIPTFEEAIKKKGPAISWLTSATDQCQPYCVDVEVLNAPACAEFENELIILEEYYYEQLDHDLKKGTVSTKGRCNRREAAVYRYTPPA
jgi:hypothetical protein